MKTKLLIFLLLLFIPMSLLAANGFIYENMPSSKYSIFNHINTNKQQVDNENLITDSIVEKIRKVPPPQFIYFTFLLAAGNLIWSIINFSLTRKNQIRESFITNSIIIPVCIEPLRDFIVSYSDKFKELERATYSDPQEILDTYNQNLELFQSSKEEMISRLSIIKSFCYDTYEEISKSLDSLDDSVTMHCFIKSIPKDEINKQDPMAFSNNLIEEMYSTLQKVTTVMATKYDSFFSAFRSFK